MTPRFNYERMRRIFYSYHGGQGSALYAAASSGLVANCDALIHELSACAESMWTDKSNFKGPIYNRTMRAPILVEWDYLRRIIAALPTILGPEHKANDGCTYRSLPWAGK